MTRSFSYSSTSYFWIIKMNTNKIIFSIVWAVLLAIIFYLVIWLSNSQKVTTQVWAGDLSVWILNDDEDLFWDFVQRFKEDLPQYSGKNITVESFSDETSYVNSLTSAFLNGVWPDIFMMSNSEESLFENQISAIRSNIISPSDFRLNYKTVFTNDLVVSNPADASEEFLRGIPVWYETLWLIYNRKFFTRPSELETWSSLIVAIKNISNRSNSIVPLALGNASWVSRSTSTIATLLWLEGATSLFTTSTNQIKQVLSFYRAFWDSSGDNKYDILSSPLVDKSDIDFFADGDVAAILAYPREIEAIDAIWYQSSFLYASTLPRYVWSDKKQVIDYNYFVLNKDSSSPTFSLDFLKYLSSSNGQLAFSDTFPYYLPAHIWVETEKLEKKIYPNYNIVYKNFISDDTELVSFNMWNRILFNQTIDEVLSLDTWNEERFSKLKSYIVCNSTKYSSLLNLSSPCRK